MLIFIRQEVYSCKFMYAFCMSVSYLPFPCLSFLSRLKFGSTSHRGTAWAIVRPSSRTNNEIIDNMKTWWNSIQREGKGGKCLEKRNIWPWENNNNGAGKDGEYLIFMIFVFCNWILHILFGFYTWSQSKVSLLIPLIIGSNLTIAGCCDRRLPYSAMFNCS